MQICWPHNAYCRKSLPQEKDLYTLFESILVGDKTMPDIGTRQVESCVYNIFFLKMAREVILKRSHSKLGRRCSRLNCMSGILVPPECVFVYARVFTPCLTFSYTIPLQWYYFKTDLKPWLHIVSISKCRTIATDRR